MIDAQIQSIQSELIAMRSVWKILFAWIAFCFPVAEA